jgi:hypothetical protein
VLFYSASGYYAIQFSSYPSPIVAFSFEDVPHSRRKCCNGKVINMQCPCCYSTQTFKNSFRKGRQCYKFDILPAVNGRGFFQSRPLELLVQRVHLLTTSCETITRDGSLLSLSVYFNTLFLYALQYSSNLNNWF